MKTNFFLFIGLVLIAQSGISGTSASFIISGTVPARGFTVSKDFSGIQPNLGSELKVYVGYISSGRNPQSVDELKKPRNIADIQNWKMLTGPKALSAINFIRVVAP